MINEICKLHSNLTSDNRLLLKMVRYDYEISIFKEDILKKVGNNTLKIIRPGRSDNPFIVNTDYIMVVFVSRRDLL